MLGGLYGDVLPPSSTTDEGKATTTSSNVWSSSAKMGPPTLLKTSSSFFQPPQTVLKPQNKAKTNATITIPTVAAEKDNYPKITSKSTSPFQPALVGVTSTVIDGYDPARPNDYEDYRREKKRRQMEAENMRRQEEEEEREIDRELNISREEARRRRAAMSDGTARPRSPSPLDKDREGFSIGKWETVGLGVSTSGQMIAAQRMMAKMGWKEGPGLGKQEQGITTPSMAKKTDRRAGAIVNSSESSQQSEKKVKSVNFTGTPTRVVLLRNMVGPGEVDDELEDEVASECAKFGKVTRVLIFEITGPNFPPDEAVRIFVQFERAEDVKHLLRLGGSSWFL